MTNQEEFEEYVAASDLQAKTDAAWADLVQELGLNFTEPADPWRHLDGIRSIGVNMVASFTDEDRVSFVDTVHHFMPSVAGMDIDITDPTELRIFLVGIGFAWRLVANELARCQAMTPHLNDHVNASLTRMAIAIEPNILAAGVRPPVPSKDEPEDIDELA